MIRHGERFEFWHEIKQSIKKLFPAFLVPVNPTPTISELGKESMSFLKAGSTLKWLLRSLTITGTHVIAF